MQFYIYQPVPFLFHFRLISFFTKNERILKLLFFFLVATRLPLNPSLAVIAAATAAAGGRVFFWSVCVTVVGRLFCRVGSFVD